MLLPTANATNPSLLIIECGTAAIAVAVAFTWPRLANNAFTRAEKAFGRLAHRQEWAVAAVGLSVLLLRLAILPLFPIPIPFVPDDFSFLLASDTFVHGRLANPTPAMWTHFETIHISMLPTYMSMYFPGQGLLLAAGKILFGDPWFALLISSSLMCAAHWALLGGFIAVLRIGVFSYFTDTYHAAGSLGALAGALILGSLPRLMKTARLRYGFLIGIGFAILVLTRPYEGVLLGLPVAFVLVRWMLKGKNRPGRAALLRLAAAPLLLIFAAATWMGYYDYKAFGNPLTPPYTVNRNAYAIAPYYVWQNQRPEPNYRYAVMRSFYHKGELDFFNKIHSLKGFLPMSLAKVAFAFLFYSNFTLLIPLIMVRRVFLDRRIRFLVACVLVLVAGMFIEIFLLPHYVAPFAAAFYAIGLQAMRHLRVWKPEGKPVGLTLVRLTVFSVVALAGLRVFAEPLHIAPSEWPASSWNFEWWGPQQFGVERKQIQNHLNTLPGGQLAIVRYSSSHDPFDEWVYNSADIDASKVVWARDMNAANNLELIHYYNDRKVWLVEPDTIPALITPYVMPD
jgi:hypothetical protein